MKRVMRRLHIAGARGIYDRAKKHRADGQWDAALAEFTEAERYFGVAYGSNHPATIGAGAQRAWCMIRLGKRDDGISVLEDCLMREVDARGDQTDLAQALARSVWEERRYVGPSETG